MEQVKGELQEVVTVNQEFYSGLLFHAKEKGYSSGWAKHKYKEKFGHWPTGAKDHPIKSDSVAGWIKHLNIKYAHAKRKREGRKRNNR